MTRWLAALALIASIATAEAQTPDPKNTIVMETTKGRIVIALRPDLAPGHAERIKLLTREGFYSNAPFHRVIPGFMAQTGDGARGNGTGNSKHPDIKAEFSNVSFTRGIVGMARKGDPNSANCQFFITLADAPHLNNQYTVIGRVVSGMDVVDKLKTGEPVRDPDRIVKMQVQSEAR
jgi:peptidylprolyl isomerase